MSEVDNWAVHPKNLPALLADALRRIEEEKAANKPAVTLFACNAEAILDHIERRRSQTLPPAEANRMRVAQGCENGAHAIYRPDGSEAFRGDTAAALTHFAFCIMELDRIRGVTEECPRCGPDCDLLPGRKP